MLPAAAFTSTAPPTGFPARLDPATKLAATALAVATCLAAPRGLVPVAAALVCAALFAAGARPRDLARSWRPWLGVAALVLAIHVLTTVEAAPLGRPSWLGLLRGLEALVRVGATVGCLALYLRIASLADTIAGLSWWLGPLRKRGLDTARLGLMLSVALGAVPGALAEGRRVEAVMRLRRGGAATGGRSGRGPRARLRRLVDRARVVVPLLEGMFRRAEGLTLSVQDRLPRAGARGRPPAAELLALAAWTAGLVLMIL